MARFFLCIFLLMRRVRDLWSDSDLAGASVRDVTWVLYLCVLLSLTVLTRPARAQDTIEPIGGRGTNAGGFDATIRGSGLAQATAFSLSGPDPRSPIELIIGTIKEGTPPEPDEVRVSIPEVFPRNLYLPGTYIVRRTISGITSSLTTAINLEDDHPAENQATLLSADRILFGQTASGTIGFNGDVDYFVFIPFTGSFLFTFAVQDDAMGISATVETSAEIPTPLFSRTIPGGGSSVVLQTFSGEIPHKIRVTNTSDPASTVSTGQYTINISPLIPSVTSVTPLSGTNFGGFEVTVTGDNLLSICEELENNEDPDADIRLVDSRFLFASTDPRIAPNVELPKITVITCSDDKVKLRLPEFGFVQQCSVEGGFSRLPSPPALDRTFLIGAVDVNVEDSPDKRFSLVQSPIEFIDEDTPFNEIKLFDDHPQCLLGTEKGCDEVEEVRDPQDRLKTDGTVFLPQPAIGFTSIDRVNSTFDTDVDVYRFAGSKDEMFTVEVRTDTDTSPSLKDPVVKVFTPDKSLFACLDDLTVPGLSSRITFITTENADYFVAVSSFGCEMGFYDVLAKKDDHPEVAAETIGDFDKLESPPGCEDFPDLRIGNLPGLLGYDGVKTDGNSIDANIDFEGDKDALEFSVEKDFAYVIETVLGEGKKLKDTRITLFNQANGQIGVSDNSTGASRIVTQIAESQRYKAVIEAAPGATVTQGNYGFRVSRGAIPAVTSVSPDTVSNEGGDVITVTGRNFAGPGILSTSVKFRPESGVGEVRTLSLGASPGASLVTATIAVEKIGEKLIPGSYDVLVETEFGSSKVVGEDKIKVIDDHPEKDKFLDQGAIRAEDQITPDGAAVDADFGWVDGNEGDTDVLTYTAAAGTVYKVFTDLSVTATPKVSDAKLSLLDSSGNTLASNDDFNGMKSSLVTFATTSGNAGSNFVLIEPVPVTAVGTYRVQVITEDHPDVIGQSSSSRDSVTSSSSVTGTLDVSGDIDVFQFAATVGSVFTVEVSTGTLLDTRVSVFSSDGSLISSNANTVGGPSTVAFPPAADGTFFIAVDSPVTTATGTYTVSLSQRTVPLISALSPSTGTNAGGFQVTASGSNLNLTTSVRLRDGSGNDITNIDIGSVRATELVVTIPARTVGSKYDTLKNPYAIILSSPGGDSAANAGSQISFVDDHPDMSVSEARVPTDVVVPDGAAVAADIGFPGDVDFFRFSATADTVYVIETSLAGKTLPDTILEFRNSADTILFSNDDASSSSKASQLLVTATASEAFFPVVRAGTSSQTGTYQLKVFVATPPTVTGVSPSRGLRDGNTPVTITGTGFSGVLDVKLSDPAGTLLTDVLFVSSTQITAVVPPGIAPGQYDIIVRNPLGANATSSVKFRVDDHPDTMPAASTSDSRDTVGVNKPPTTAVRESAEDADLFRFTAVSGHTYTIETQLLTLNDTDLTLFSTDGATVLARNNDIDSSRGILTSRIVFTATLSGVHFLRVGSPTTGTGNYSVTVVDPQTPDDHPNRSTATRVPEDVIGTGGTPVDATIEYGGDIDFYRFDAVAGANYDIETEVKAAGNTLTLRDSVLTVLDRNGTTTLAENDDDPGDLSTRASRIIGFQPPVSGTYFIRVRHFDPGASSTGTYRLKVTRRADSIALFEVRAPSAKVSRGQSLPVDLIVGNTGTSDLVSLSGSLRLTTGTQTRTSQYTITPDPGNAAGLSPGVTTAVRLNVLVSPTATLGPVRADGTATALVSGTGDTVSDGTSQKTTAWTVQTPARLSIVSFTAPSQVSRGQSLTVTMSVQNTGQADLRITTAALSFTLAGGTPGASEYTAVLSASSLTTIPGLGTRDLEFTVSVDSSATLGPVTIDGSASGTDVNSGRTVSDTGANLPLQWSVRTQASLFIRSIQLSQSAVSQGQRATLAARVENPGSTPATILTSTFVFVDLQAGDHTNEYGVIPDPANPIQVPARSRVDLLYTVTVGAGATPGEIRVDGSLTARDDTSGSTLTVLRADLPASWTVQTPAQLSVVSVTTDRATVSRGASLGVTVTVRNIGQAAAELTGTSFLLLLGVLDVSGDYRITTSPSNPTRVPGGGEAGLDFTLAAAADATTGTVGIEPTLTSRDENSGAVRMVATPKSLAGSFRLGFLTVRISSPRSSDILFPDEDIAISGSAVDDQGVPLSPSSLLYRSDVKGLLGVGNQVTTTLASGPHVISLEANSATGLSGTTQVAVLVRDRPAPVTTLVVNGQLLSASGTGPAGAGFRVVMTNASRRLTSETTSQTAGQYSVTFAPVTTGGAVAGPGDRIDVRVHAPDGLRRGIDPASFVLISRDVFNNLRDQDLSVEELISRNLVLHRGLNLVSLPIEPSTTTARPYQASDLARATGSPFVVRRVKGPAGQGTRSEVHLGAEPTSPDFVLTGNEGYLLMSPAGGTAVLQGFSWDPQLLFRELGRGENFVGFPLGFPVGFDAQLLLDRVSGGRSVMQAVLGPEGVGRFETYAPGLSTSPFKLSPGRGYIVVTRTEGTLLLPSGP